MPKPRVTLFLSGVSHEFGNFRDAVESKIEMKRCFAENQPGFPPDYCTVEERLTRKLPDSDALICIVGFRLGAEPNHTARRDTSPQLEANFLLKTIWVYLNSHLIKRSGL